MKRNIFHLIWIFAVLLLSGSVAILFFINRDLQDDPVQKPEQETAERPADPNAREPEEEKAQKPESDPPEAREIITQFIEAYNSRDTTAIKSLFANPVFFNGEAYDIDDFIRNSWVDRLWLSFPNARIEPTHLVATDEYSVVLQTITSVPRIVIS